MISNFILDNYPALGTYFWIEVFEDLPLEKISEVSEIIKKEITDFENKYSRFKSDSLVSKLNQNSKLENAPTDLIEMINISFKISELTNNTFNICLLNQLEKSGYDTELTFKEKDIELPLIAPASDLLKINEKNIFLKKDYQIDLGGIGKGYLVDKISKIIKDNFGINYFLVNGGGDIFVTSDNGNPVEINLQNPINNLEFIGSVYLKNQALCASSPFKRKWKGSVTNKIYSHIVDSNGINKFNSSFVVGDNSVICDTVATALCIDENCLSEFNEVSFLVLNYEGKILKNTF